MGMAEYQSSYFRTVSSRSLECFFVLGDCFRGELVNTAKSNVFASDSKKCQL